MKEMKKGTSELYGGDSYVILYTYSVNGREQYIVYYWQVGDQYGIITLFKNKKKQESYSRD